MMYYQVFPLFFHPIYVSVAWKYYGRRIKFREKLLTFKACAIAIDHSLKISQFNLN